MKRIKLQMQLSVDGFVAGPGEAIDWLQCNWDAGLKEYMNTLKQQHGKNFIVYGSSNFDMSMIKDGLVDEYFFLINPTATGKGIAIFKEFESKMNLRLVNARSFECGVVLLSYKPE